MKFRDPFYFLLLIPAVTIFILYIRGWIGKDAVLKFSSVDLVKKAGARKLSLSRFFPACLRLMATILLILALARPQTGTGEEKTTEHVVDIVIALDVSGSMATLDFHPDNRLVAAKLEASEFIKNRPKDRIGFVIFAGQSITQSPLTTDHDAVLSLVNQIQLGMVEDGTAIGLGLASAVNRLKSSEAKSKVVILLTDGVNNAGEIDPLTAADLAKQFGIRVYTIGVGKEGEAFLPVNDPQFGTRMLRVRTQIDERMLANISSKTGGQYFRAQDEHALREIFKEIDKLERTEITVDRYMHYEEHYFMFLWPALFILLLEIFWTNFLIVRLP